MSTRSTPGGQHVPPRKPRDQLRHWSTYTSPGEYWADYRGYVPLAMMVGITRLMREHDLAFADAYRMLLDAGAIIHVAEVPEDHRT